MPELPDVEVLKRYLDSTALHQKIENVDVGASWNEYRFPGAVVIFVPDARNKGDRPDNSNL